MTLRIDAVVKVNQVDKSAYDIYYQNGLSNLIQAEDKKAYIERYEQIHHRPFFCGGRTKSYVRSLATKAILEKAQPLHVAPSDITILDAGCGRGELSVYLGFTKYQKAAFILTVKCQYAVSPSTSLALF